MAEKAQGITKITVGGYKSIRDETTIEIRPLTILAGANSSGKSSIMQPMLMMKQTLEATYDPGPLLINGPNARFTLYEQLIPKSQDSLGHTLVAGFGFLVDLFDIGQELKLRNEFTIAGNDNSKKSISLTKMQSNYPSNDFGISPRMSSNDILQQIPDGYLRPAEELRKSRDGNSDVTWEVVSERCFLYIGLFENLVLSGKKYRYEYQRAPFNPAPFLESSIANLVHVPGLRGNLLRTYPLAHIQGPRYPGHFQDYAASMLLRWKEEDDKSITLVEKNLSNLGLTKWVDPVRVDDANVEIQVGRLPVTAYGNPKDDLVSIADVGIGVSQVLPVLVALIAAEPGQMVYIEQPEMHLHPKAQVALASVLADAAKRGVRVVVETHSSLLLQGVMTLISEGVLSNEIVKLHWFERNQEGNTIVTSKDFHENGTHDGDWPVDFADIRLEEQRRYLDAVTKHRMGLVNEPS